MSGPTLLSANYVLLDAARMDGGIHRARELNSEHTCLYEGDSERFLSAVAPWLFAFNPASPFAEWLAQEGKGKSWGIFLSAHVEPVRLYKHLRRFLIVEGDDGRELYFRYYDPRVLSVFLPTCEPDPLRAFFGPIEAFLAENENGKVIEYALHDGTLHFLDSNQDLEECLMESAHSEEMPYPEPERGRAEAAPENEEDPPASTPPAPTSAGEGRSKNWDFGY
jgi:hypothetical protein